ncbi:MAG: DUF1772 domain-containing protein [Pseudolysinimonas sp.]|uniref:DUF1772 domain-containing protein n=1 Tax=Pseudolysinimonas sp. TaxID=2680009 RepID=UPI003263D1EB
MSILVGLGLMFAGLLAGIEAVVRYGVHPALNAMPDDVHLRARHEIVRIVRVIVPAVMLPSVVVAVVCLVVTSSGPAYGLRFAAVAVYAIYLVVVFAGTVPINDRFFKWDVSNPPADWKSVIRRWALIDVVRSSAAIVAFGLLVAAAVI